MLVRIARFRHHFFRLTFAVLYRIMIVSRGRVGLFVGHRFPRIDIDHGLAARAPVIGRCIIHGISPVYSIQPVTGAKSSSLAVDRSGTFPPFRPLSKGYLKIGVTFLSLCMNKSRRLRYLARIYGIAPSYTDYKGRHKKAGDKILIDLINARSNGHFTTGVTQPEVLQTVAKLRQSKIRTMLPPVITAWSGKAPAIWVWADDEIKTVHLALTPDDKNGKSYRFDLQPTAQWARKVNNKTCYRLRLDLDRKIGFGSYEVTIKTDSGQTGESYLISAPAKLKNAHRSWGGFAPAYALHDQKTRYCGGYRELYQAAAFVKDHGGGFIGTLPLWPVFYEGQHKEVSPYTPISRFFWNELFVDLENLPGVRNIDLPAEGGHNQEIIDYSESYAAVKSVLLRAADQFFNTYPEGDDAYQAYKKQQPLLQDYATLVARRTADNQHDIKQVQRYHLYAQYACHVQLQDFKTAAEQEKVAGLYLDHTVGVHPQGFDAAHYQTDFINGLSIGAPPDMMFEGGQNWGFHPLDPAAQIKNRFSYLRACFTHYFRYARMVRIDHIMGLQRLYCIPAGQDATEGSYLYYPQDAQLALLCLIAWQQDGILIGEDLGTVSQKIRKSLTRHGINRMWVGQFELKPDWTKSFRHMNQTMMACMNTHDMFPFTAFVKGIDIDRFHALGMMDAKDHKTRHKERAQVIKSLKVRGDPYLTYLSGMAESKARYLMINFEDLWDETEPQNMPGITDAYPNWRKKFSQPIDGWAKLPKVKQALEILKQHRSSSL